MHSRKFVTGGYTVSPYNTVCSLHVLKNTKIDCKYTKLMTWKKCAVFLTHPTEYHIQSVSFIMSKPSQTISTKIILFTLSVPLYYIWHTDIKDTRTYIDVKVLLTIWADLQCFTEDVEPCFSIFAVFTLNIHHPDTPHKTFIIIIITVIQCSMKKKFIAYCTENKSSSAITVKEHCSD